MPLLASELPHGDRAAPVPGVQALLKAHRNHTVERNLGTGLSSALPTPTTADTHFPSETQPGVTSSRKLALTFLSLRCNPLRRIGQVVPSSVVHRSVSQASLGTFFSGRGHPSSKSTAVSST